MAGIISFTRTNSSQLRALRVTTRDGAIQLLLPPSFVSASESEHVTGVTIFTLPQFDLLLPEQRHCTEIGEATNDSGGRQREALRNAQERTRARVQKVDDASWRSRSPRWRNHDGRVVVGGQRRAKTPSENRVAPPSRTTTGEAAAKTEQEDP